LFFLVFSCLFLFFVVLLGLFFDFFQTNFADVMPTSSIWP
jgi:hypothetical protein